MQDDENTLTDEPSGDVTDLLKKARAGQRTAFEELVPMVYDDLRRVARRQLRRSRDGQTLDTTGLVHEAYLKLNEGGDVDWQSRGHFFAVAARAMRQVVIAYARKRQATKRGGGERPLSLDEARIAVETQAEWLLALDDVLERLGEHNERLVRVVECRFFAGLSEEETAEAIGVSLRTVQRDWMRARAWLKVELAGLQTN